MNRCRKRADQHTFSLKIQESVAPIFNKTKQPAGCRNKQWQAVSVAGRPHLEPDMTDIEIL
jgi:hypothetical protein